MRSAPIWVGSTTLLAPAWISLRSVETASPRAMISILRFRLRARQRDEDVGGVVGQHGGQRARAVDAGVVQRRLVGGVALQAEMAGLARLLDAALVLFEHDDRRRGRP